MTPTTSSRVGWLSLLALFLLVVATGLSMPSASLADPPSTVEGSGPIPDPVADPNNPDIFYGAEPTNPNGELLLFVHGYGAQAEVWWVEGLTAQDNDIYERAFAAGYRTAFVTLKDLNGPGPSSMWVHGERLAQQIAIITAHYGFSQLDIVAHSKGGLDSEAAIAHYGANQSVDHVFTLGTPHYGTELADLLYSPEVEPIANTLGLLNEGTETLTTAYVETEFRPVTDPIQQQQDVIYWRAAGTSNDPLYSGTWFTGLYLNSVGINDGVVPLARTRLPLANRLFERAINHGQLTLGENAFRAIDNVIRTGEASTTLFLPMTAGGNGPPFVPLQSESIVRSGFLLPNIPRTVSLGDIEPGAVEASFATVVIDDSFTGALIQPDGTEIPLQGQALQGGTFFGDLWGLVAIVEAPQAGEWKLRVQGPQLSAFFMIAEIKSPLSLTVEGLPTTAVAPDQPLTLHVAGSHPSGPVQIDEVTVRSVAAGAPSERLAGRAAGDRITVATPLSPGLHGVSIQIHGRLANGEPFSRTKIGTLWVSTPQ